MIKKIIKGNNLGFIDTDFMAFDSQSEKCYLKSYSLGVTASLFRFFNRVKYRCFTLESLKRSYKWIISGPSDFQK